MCKDNSSIVGSYRDMLARRGEEEERGGREDDQRSCVKVHVTPLADNW